MGQLSHLDELEAEAIYIIREVAAECEKPVMLYSIGKDSSVMLHLAMKAFYPEKPPFPFLHVNTTWKFKEMIEFRDYMAKKLGIEMIEYINEEGVKQGINPFDHGSAYTDIMKTQALKQALDKYGFTAAFGGGRRDEEKSRAKERIFSFRNEHHAWDPKNQRPEMWKLYNSKIKKKEEVRVFPLSNWTEKDIWQYIKRENIEHAASMGGSQCFFEAGEEQTVQDMIKCIEVASGNDAAVAMAEHLAGSEAAFVQKMNERAKELGMEHTHFDNACGLEVETHLTSARDIAIMSRQLLLYHPDILTYSTIWMDSITHKTRRGESQFDLANTNKFLNLYTGANGLKTGYTSQAKYCMSATATRDGVTLIAVVMGAETKEIRNSEAMKLLDYGFAQCRPYVDTEVVPEDLQIPVQNGTCKSVTVKPVEQHTITLVATNPDQIEKQVIAYENLKAPIQEGDAVGVVQYSCNGTCISEVILYAERSVPKLDLKYSLSEIAGRIFMAK